MNVKLNLALMAAVVFFISPAFAQIDGTKFATDLRMKYGPALPRETFVVRPGIEMIVDYASNGHVCKIQLPPIGPSPGPGVVNGRAIDEITLELVPMALRGKEVGRLMEAMGMNSVAVVQYENVNIAEAFQAQRRTGVTISFNGEGRPAQ